MSVAASADSSTLSFVSRGLFHRILCLLGVSLPDSPRLVARAISLVGITWLPLLAISIWNGVAVGRAVHVPFLLDFNTHARFLIAVPLYILAEAFIDPVLQEGARHFASTGIVPESERPRFDAAIRRVAMLHQSVLAEIFLLALAYVLISVGVWREQDPGRPISFWHTPSVEGPMTAAAWWYALVSIPIHHFLLFRWVWRLIVWGAFLRRVNRLDLRLTPTHPDGVGGLGFLSSCQLRFAIVIFAAACSIAGAAANRLLYRDIPISELQIPVAAFAIVAVPLFISPLLLFSRRLFQARRSGIFHYGALAADYTQQFDKKWVEHKRDPHQEPILGTQDIQSLADLQSSVQVVHQMKYVPVDKALVGAFVAAAILPMLPLVFIAFPADEVIARILNLLF